MLNLLFISDSPKVEHIKNVLQPVLKVIIDVVTDFDHGLKDVFEKRPTTVCIQDQIGGVTGESVARHIQMLLGSGAPTFILLHTGNGKARTIRGLYEHLIDLSQPDEIVSEQIIGTLKSLLGDQWERVYIPPKQTPASLKASINVPEEEREVADKFVDDFLSDFETTGFSDGDTRFPAASSIETPSKKTTGPELFAAPSHTEIPFGATESDHVQTTSDELAELLLAEVSKAAKEVRPSTESPDVPATREVPFSAAPTPKMTVDASSAPAIPVLPGPLVPPVGGTQKKPLAVVKPVGRDVTSDATSGPRSMMPQAPARPAKPEATVPPAAAEFRINQNAAPAEEHFPEELLQAFEENYRSESQFLRRSVIVVLVCAISAAGAWYLFKQKPLLISSLKQRFMSSTGATQSPVAAAIPAQTPVPVSVPPPPVTPQLPAFIPKDGLDTSFSVSNPGWERYVGKDAEFRIFKASGSIQAVQVLSVKDALIPDVLIKSVLKECNGSPEFQITSRSTKAGVRIERGRTLPGGDIIIYRKGGAVTAFVVSVN